MGVVVDGQVMNGDDAGDSGADQGEHVCRTVYQAGARGPHPQRRDQLRTEDPWSSIRIREERDAMAFVERAD